MTAVCFGAIALVAFIGAIVAGLLALAADADAAIGQDDYPYDGQE